MNTNNTNSTESESAEMGALKPSTQWNRPPLGKSEEDKGPRIRLEVKLPEKSKRKGRMVNQFLLREEAEETSDSQETIRAKRREFKALFEAGMNR